jgi:thiol:disulfide interchange protein DsbD
MEYVAYFILGLSLNLTPCIYPMLTITLSLFRSSDAKSHGQSFLRALVYVSGITVMFTLIGVLAALTGEFFGLFLQNFWVLLVMSLFIIVLSLSMFGLYTFRFPSWMIPQRGMPSGKTFVEFFLSGLLVGIVAAPCVGPVVLSLLTAVSQTGDAVYGAVCFLILSLGMGSPYLALGAFSGLLKKLPKSGAWLIWFERLLGVVLFSFGCFYLIIAFRWPLLGWLVPVTAFVGGIYLGWIERSADESKRFRMFKRIIGTLISAAGAVAIVTLLLLHGGNGMAWERYRPDLLEEARAAGQPVMFDFYADWCIPCHELDRFTYSDPSVIRALDGFRRVKVDTTYLNDDVTKRLVEDFGVVGVPTVIFLDEQGKEVDEMRISGFVGPHELLDSLRSGPLNHHLPAAEQEAVTERQS